MKKFIAIALAMTVFGIAAVEAAPHHRHRVCTVRHHHRICHWR